MKDGGAAAAQCCRPTRGSMKIARCRRQRAEQFGVIGEPARHQMNHIAFALHFALDAHQARAQQFAALALDDAVPHHHVDVAGFILQRDEHHAAGGAGALAAGDNAGGAGDPAIGQLRQCRGGNQLHAGETRAQEC